MKHLICVSLILSACATAEVKDELDKQIEESERLEQKYQSDIDSNLAKSNRYQDSLEQSELKKF